MEHYLWEVREQFRCEWRGVLTMANSFVCFGTLPLSGAPSLLVCALRRPIGASSWPRVLIYRRRGEL
jgi:hypothetical protein